MRRLRLHKVDARDERGATLIVIALSMVALLGLIVLAVDLGGLLVKRRSMVNSNDSAALAAAISFATNEAQVGSNEAPAMTEADAFATDNVANAIRDEFVATAGLSGSSCDPTTCGSVHVEYHGNQGLFFAPAIGLGSAVDVHAKATAIWGPAGGGNPSPISIRYDWMQDGVHCDEPVPSPNPPVHCWFWLDNNNDSGNAIWYWINLDNTAPDQGWDVGRYDNCQSSGQNDIRNWINGIDVPDLPVNDPPTPTFVCTISGLGAGSFYDDLANQAGELRVFPVNDALGQFAPPGQVDKQGDWCNPATCTAVDKFDIVGFTAMRIALVLRGNDPDAYGDPGGPGTCGPNHSFTQNPPGNTWDLDSQSCNITDLHYPDDVSKLYPRITKGSTTFTGDLTGNCAGLDYCYDTGTHVITWQRSQNVNKTKVEWDYVQPPTEGECGIQDPDSSSVCVTAEWEGFQTGGFDPGGGEDFGLRAVKISD